ncbi:hypothetical protein [Mitsuokella jalaludinii]|uniref:hypothetical protein n=1 Tax=Mitsuokella jalaludinii TaxID=187979 RepID=UPI003078CE7C
MRLSNKHANVQTIEYRDFSGGLNTTNAAERIAMNELARAVNVEIDKSTGLLKTCCGTDKVYADEKKSYRYLIYDAIEGIFLLTDADQKVYSMTTDGKTVAQVGVLTGKDTVSHAAWEEGVLIASGGPLQYYHGGTLETIARDESNASDKTPAECHGVFVKDGRVWVYYEDELHCSAVGDEHGWTQTSDDNSSAQWLQVGYKDGGKITGVCALSSDTIIFKSNQHAYHLAGKFPNWVLSEIGRTIGCKGEGCCVSLGNTVLALGLNMLQSINVTDRYGDMQAAEVSRKISGDVRAMGAIRLRYIAPLNQVWMLNGKLLSFYFLDANGGGFFERQYNSVVMDAQYVGDAVYVLKEHGVYRLNGTHMTDDGEEMKWAFQGRTLVPQNNYLIKRVRADITPYFSYYAEERFRVGGVTLFGTLPDSSHYVWHNYGQIYHSRIPVSRRRGKRLYNNSDEVFEDWDYIYKNDTYIKSLNCYRAETRCVNRLRSVKVGGYGAGGMTLFNGISFDIVEV